MSEDREIINRATRKRLQRYSREELNEWLQTFATFYYNRGLRDSVAAEITAMRDELGFGTLRVARVINRRNEIVDAINRNEFDADTIIDVLSAEEGLKIKDYIVRRQEYKEDDKSDVK